MPVTPELRHAFNHYRRPSGKYEIANRMVTARAALGLARNELRMTEKRRFTSSPWAKPYGAVSWACDNARGERLAYVQSIEGAGLRLVGEVAADERRGNIWHTRANKTGWYTDPYGDASKDGTGLCWGVVYQLPARDGKARFVAGYIMGGCSDDLPMVDFGTVYTGESYWDGSPTECDAAIDAACAADSMAHHAAEQEREYQTAWQAGSAYASALEERASLKTELRALLGERRQAMRELAAQGIGVGVKGGALCAAIERRARDMLESLAEISEKARNLAAGDGGEYLSFWPGDATLKAAFNEGAGQTVLD